MRRWLQVWLVACTIGLGACSGFKQSIEDSGRTTTALKSELGVDARVSFNTVSGHTFVAVHLASPPSGDAAATKSKITDIVNKTFRAKVERVDVSF